MYIIMVGPPGSGKGTIGIELCGRFNLTHLGTGDIFREEISKQTELGLEAHKYISKGELVPDDITIQMVEAYLDKLENVLLDGFPRTIPQADALQKYLQNKGKSITAVIELNVPDEDIVTRTSSRVVCPDKKCGAAFNTIFMPPKVDGICDKCGKSLIKRKDDNPETIRERLEVYHSDTEVLIDYYRKLNLVERIDIDIYSPTTKEDSINAAEKAILKRCNR